MIAPSQIVIQLLGILCGRAFVGKSRSLCRPRLIRRRRAAWSAPRGPCRAIARSARTQSQSAGPPLPERIAAPFHTHGADVEVRLSASAWIIASRTSFAFLTLGSFAAVAANCAVGEDALADSAGLWAGTEGVCAAANTARLKVRAAMRGLRIFVTILNGPRRGKFRGAILGKRFARSSCSSSLAGQRPPGICTLLDRLADVSLSFACSSSTEGLSSSGRRKSLASGHDLTRSTITRIGSPMSRCGRPRCPMIWGCSWYR